MSGLPDGPEAVSGGAYSVFMTAFRSSRLKIERANQHINELASIFGFFLQTDFYRLSIEKDPQGMDVLSLQPVTALPPQAPLAIGDAVHNLRSALDHAAYEIVASSGATPSRDLAFPIASSREAVVGTLNGGEIEAAGGRGIIDLIVDTVRPYKGGNDALYSLHRLDITDKHHLVIPVAALVGLRGVSAEDSNHNIFQSMDLSVGEGGRLNAIATSGTLKITDYGHPAFAVMFGKDQPFEGEAVLPTLHQLTQLVAGIVQAIEKAHSTHRDGSP